MNMTQEERDTYYLDIAKAVSVRSTCHYSVLGCVIVDMNDNVISTSYLSHNNDLINCKRDGYCHYKDTINDTSEEPNLGVPEHCIYMFPEVQAILMADRKRLQDATLYVYLQSIKTGEKLTPKLERTVAKVIYASGIKRIVTT